MLVCLELVVPQSNADTLSDKQQLMQQLQDESSQAFQEISKEKQHGEAIQNNIQAYQSLIDNVNKEITANEQQIQVTQNQLAQLNVNIAHTKAQLERYVTDYKNMIRVLYENGEVSYLDVLLKSTSFDDLISRINTLSLITKADHDLAMKVASLKDSLDKQKQAKEATNETLNHKQTELHALRQMDMNLKNQQQQALSEVNQHIQTVTARQHQLQLKIHLTQSQINQIEQETKHAEAILSTSVSEVAEKDLRYQNISPEALYNYVHNHGSIFTIQDIQTICNAANTYDVNPALLIAITGQEQNFVPPGPDAEYIRNNPFNVFYSWQVYNTDLADSANIAANTLRHKLSVPPPAGEDAILWINDPRNPWGIYAQDPKWAYGVRSFFDSIIESIR
jgi:peptidoglycan hydrolase CwlO-like protein